MTSPTVRLVSMQRICFALIGHEAVCGEAPPYFDGGSCPHQLPDDASHCMSQVQGSLPCMRCQEPPHRCKLWHHKMLSPNMCLSLNALGMCCLLRSSMGAACLAWPPWHGWGGPYQGALGAARRAALSLPCLFAAALDQPLRSISRGGPGLPARLPHCVNRTAHQYRKIIILGAPGTSALCVVSTQASSCTPRLSDADNIYS